MRLQVVILGPQKQPSYVQSDGEKARWYRICYNTSYRSGDGIHSLFEWQCAFMCPTNMEVYKTHEFEEIDWVILDRDLIELEDWIYENCAGLIEICDNGVDEYL